jgi:hypothetical protein
VVLDANTWHGPELVIPDADHEHMRALQQDMCHAVKIPVQDAHQEVSITCEVESALQARKTGAQMAS